MGAQDKIIKAVVKKATKKSTPKPKKPLTPKQRQYAENAIRAKLDKTAASPETISKLKREFAKTWEAKNKKPYPGKLD